MRFQRVSYLTFWLALPIPLFAAGGVHAQGVMLSLDGGRVTGPGRRRARGVRISLGRDCLTVRLE
jgi:hypothetical protein